MNFGSVSADVVVWEAFKIWKKCGHFQHFYFFYFEGLISVNTESRYSSHQHPADKFCFDFILFYTLSPN